MRRTAWSNTDMSFVFAVLVILVIGGAVTYATGRWGGGLTPAEPELRPARTPSDFDVVLRGYRMDEVDARIADLEQQVADLRDGRRGEARG